MSRLTAAALLAGLLALQANALLAAEHFESGPERVALVELYTSEGCSSCPPADRWLSSLVDDPDLFEDFVPIGFHVDYWNYIGWKDRFSDRAFSERQRRYIDEGAARVVYTPGFFVAGEEWLGWRRGRDIAESRDTVGVLQARVDGETVVVSFAPGGAGADRLDLHVILLGMGLETRVHAGENRGRELRHDFVALDHSVKRVQVSDGVYEAALQIEADGYDASGLAIAVWVSEPGSQQPIQATGGLL